MHIGLIGGIGPAATDFYYRRLIAAFAGQKEPLELTIAHADAPTLLGNLARNDTAGQAAIFTRLTKRLVLAGANCVAITSIAGHFCIDAFRAQSPLPAVDMIAEVNRALSERGFTRVGILGTRSVMETRVYGGVTSAEIIPPDRQDLHDVHQAYVTMATSGVVTESQRSVFNAASHRLLRDKGAHAILLGGTDLVLVYDERTSDFPVIDCAGIHVDAIARLAIGQ
jgi:aspartate racemase